MIENILIIDTETNGLHPDKGDKCIEMAAIFYSIKHKTILQNLSTLYPCETNNAEHINGISVDSTRASYPLAFLDIQIVAMAKHAQCLVAHNASFDKKFLRTLNFWPAISDMPWVCTKDDFKWPVTLYRNRLQDICQAMNVPYVDAHRALNDCRLIAECFNRVGDLEIRFQSAMASGQRHTGYGSKRNAYV